MLGDARAVPGRDASGAAGVRLEAAGAAGDAAAGRAAAGLEQCVRAGGRREVVSGEWTRRSAREARRLERHSLRAGHVYSTCIISLLYSCCCWAQHHLRILYHPVHWTILEYSMQYALCKFILSRVACCLLHRVFRSVSGRPPAREDRNPLGRHATPRAEHRHRRRPNVLRTGVCSIVYAHSTTLLYTQLNYSMLTWTTYTSKWNTEYEYTSMYSISYIHTSIN